VALSGSHKLLKKNCEKTREGREYDRTGGRDKMGILRNGDRQDDKGTSLKDREKALPLRQREGMTCFAGGSKKTVRAH